MTDFNTIIRSIETAATTEKELRNEIASLKTRLAECENGTTKNSIVGYIYILTNPTMPGLVKIGYADDVPSRMKSLYNTSVAAPFECYAMYGIENRLLDKTLHNLIDGFDPDLRMTENREYYRMAPERAYEILYSIARINARENNLIFNPYGTVEEATEEETVSNKRDENGNHKAFEGIVFKGKRYSCRNYADAFRTVARVLYAENKDIIDEMVDHKCDNFKFTSSPIVYANKYVRAHKFDENVEIYLYDNYVVNELIKHSYELIKLYGYDERELTFVEAE